MNFGVIALMVATRSWPAQRSGGEAHAEDEDLVDSARIRTTGRALVTAVP